MADHDIASTPYFRSSRSRLDAGRSSAAPSRRSTGESSGSWGVRRGSGSPDTVARRTPIASTSLACSSREIGSGSATSRMHFPSIFRLDFGPPGSYFLRVSGRLLFRYAYVRVARGIHDKREDVDEWLCPRLQTTRRRR